MATIQVAEGSAYAQTIHSAVQAHLLEINWAPDENDTTLADYITMMLVNGKDENAVKSELAGDLLGVGEEDPMVPEFTQWLFTTARGLDPEQASNPTQQMQDSSMQLSNDAQMDDAGTSVPVPGAPTGPKAGRNGRGRSGRMLGQMNRQMDRSQDVPDSLRRIKGAARGGGGRINGHAGRDGARNGRGQNLANGVHRMINGMNGMNGNDGPSNAQMQQPGGMLGQLDPQNQMMFMQMMEMQAQMMQQMAQGQMTMGGPGAAKGGPRGRPGFDPLDKRGHNKIRNNKTEGEPGMEVDSADKKSLFETMCRFNEKCSHPDCGFAHQSPAITKPNAPIDMKDTCSYGARCTNFKCAGRHPSPCLSELWQQRQQAFYNGQTYQETTLCRFYPNCTKGDECPYIHSDSAQTSIACRYNPCTKPNCPFVHAEGQHQNTNGTSNNVWTADGSGNGTAENGATVTKSHRFAGFKENESQPEELIKPHQDMASMDTQAPT